MGIFTSTFPQRQRPVVAVDMVVVAVFEHKTGRGVNGLLFSISDKMMMVLSIESLRFSGCTKD